MIIGYNLINAPVIYRLKISSANQKPEREHSPRPDLEKRIWMKRVLIARRRRIGRPHIIVPVDVRELMLRIQNHALNLS